MADIINILPDSVANQIAAGEVIDRPASAVKEMLENSLDAGAKQIQLIVKDAGRTLIQVIDDGCGMSDSDARICFERHATSKIHQSDDLYNLHTMGFRGEALPSIASISQVELRTRKADSELGTCLTVESCMIQGQTPCSCPVGTSIAVKNLFYNVPARRNFLKKDTVELSHIEEIFKRIALAHSETAFTFYSNGRLLYDLHASNLAQRIANIFGQQYHERLYHVEEHSEIGGINGYISKAAYVKKTRGEQYLFVNGRYIKHAALSASIEKAYNDLVPAQSYPSYFIMLEVDPSRIDVNIHPAKTEVKFIDEHSLFAILRAAAKKALGQFDLASQLEFNPSTDIDFTTVPKGYMPHTPKVDYNPDYNPFESTLPGDDNPTTSSHKANVPRSLTIESRINQPQIERQRETMFTNFFNDETEPDKRPANGTERQTTYDRQGSACIQIGKQWIAVAMSSGLLIVNQQRAQERIVYERLLRSQSQTRQLMFPINCCFSPADADVFNELTPDLTSNGFAIDPLGKNTFVISAIPTDIDDNDLQEFFDLLIEEYKSSLLQNIANRSQCLCKTMAHKAALHSDTILQQEEMQQMLADLFSCQMTELTPSGKRIYTLLDENALTSLVR